jgi:glucose/mannose-6-phosphate isomerase
MTIDKSDYLSVLENFPRQCREALELTKGMKISGKIGSIVICGMGGSAIGGDMLKSYMRDNEIPVVVNRDYNLPKFVNESTLVFVISYSGNTEETLSCYKEAVKKKATIWGITSGGKLEGLCKNIIKIPSGLQPRAATGYLFFPMLGLLYNTGIIDVKNAELNEFLDMIKDVEKFKSAGEELAKKMKEKLPIIYSSNLFEPVAYRIKTQFNENSKHPSYHHTFSEMNHNEILSVESMERSKFIVFMIRDEGDHPRIKKRMDICKDIFERNVDVEEIKTQGKYLLTRMFSAIYLGDFITYYLAINKRVDPAPVVVIEWLKKKLG